MKLFNTVLIVTFALLAWTPVQAEVIHRQFSEKNLLVKVTNDAWQPENFENGMPIPASYIKQAGITLDGQDNEPAWATAQEVLVPLDFGNIKDASVKALYTDQEVFIRVRWADSTENRSHHPWIWDSEQNRYVAAPQIEDSILLSFEAGCEWNPSFLSGYVYDFDGWHWLAARSDPVGQAWDLRGSLSDSGHPTIEFTPFESRNTKNTWILKFDDTTNKDLSLQNWNELDRRYLYNEVIPTVYYRAELDRLKLTDVSEHVPAPKFAPADKTENFPQFKAVKLENGAGEVGAKGHWENGYWTVEFRRNLVTPAGTVNDTVFNRLTQFSLHVFDHVEKIDQASESKRLFLQFLPKGQKVVSN